MANKFEWLTTPVDDVEPEQYVEIVRALGDWIEAHLAHIAFLNAKMGEMSWPDLSKLLTAATAEMEAKKKDAKQRAITAGYVWRLDLDP